MAKFIDLTGKKFGRLTGVKKVANRSGRTFWEFSCSCGNKVEARGEHVRNGITVSCGCFSIDSHTKHGMSRTRTYHCWQSIKERCNNKNNPGYSDYGGRGISVCDEWLSFDAFYLDMGTAPPNYTIERIENHGSYCKANCKWATREEQARNKRSNRMYTMGEKTQCLKDWCTEYRIPYTTAINRINMGMAFPDAILL